MNKRNVVELKNVSVIRDDCWILKNISFSVREGECCAIIGPNGAGKSTLIAVIMGYLWATQGSVRVLGKCYGEVELYKTREKIGLIEPSWTPQCKDWMDVRDVVATGLFGTVVLSDYKQIRHEDWHRIDTEIESFDLCYLSRVPFGRLSSGEQKKVLIARAMVSKPKLLILDEPTSTLDPGARWMVVKTLEKLLSRKDSPALIIVSHHIEEIPMPLNQVVLIKKGQVMAQGSPEKTLTSKHISHLFDCKVIVLSNNGRYLLQIKQ